MKTFSLKADQVQNNWIVIDASDIVVGRLASYIVTLLKGKNKPEHTPHIDCGDRVIIVNAEKVAFTGNKLNNKIYYRHTGHPGGLKATKLNNLLNSKFPERALKLAVKRMLGDGPMARRRLDNLYIYKGPNHRHQAQKPEILDFSALNSKNIREVKNV